jgi:O-methyltransferase
MNNLISSVFFGVKNPEFLQGIQQAISNTSPEGIYSGDNMFTIGRNLSFIENEKFVTAWKAHAETNIEHAIVWRIYVLAWFAKSVLMRKVPGDFVECACYKGTSARIVCDYVDFLHSNRHYYLYDLFEHDDTMVHHAMPEHGNSLYAQVKQRFAALPNVTVTQGFIPQILDEVAPEVISFLHIDMNNAAAEIGALERLFDRLSPGGILVLDDYGWRAYREQKLAEDPWLAARGYEVLELPTGQGIVIK